MLAIITPVKNESRRLIHTAEQLISQSFIPKRWLIVDDASTDTTPNLIKKLERDYEFILRICISKRSGYDAVFGYRRVVRAGFDYALGFCRKLKFLGVLDVDIRPEKNYYEEIVNAFENVHRLGVASGLFFIPKKSSSSYLVPKNGQN